MTPAEFQTRRKRIFRSRDAAAAAFGVHLATIQRIETDAGPEVPTVWALALERMEQVRATQPLDV